MQNYNHNFPSSWTKWSVEPSHMMNCDLGYDPGFDWNLLVLAFRCNKYLCPQHPITKAPSLDP